jgi:hypothetical protein
MKYCWRTYVEVGYIRSFDILFNTIAPNDQNGIVYYTHTKFIYKKKRWKLNLLWDDDIYKKLLYAEKLL